MQTHHTTPFAKLKSFWLRLNPASAFLVIGLTVGLAFCFITPPFQVPDEVVHFYRAYQISEGHLIARSVPGGYGDMVPSNMPRQITDMFGDISHHPSVRYDATKTLKYLTEPLDYKKLSPVRFEASATYSPLAYVPQSIGIGIGRLLHLPLVALLFLGRIANLAAWIVMIYIALRLIPFGKWALFVLALTPMSIFEAASVSTDPVINGSAFIFVAVCLRLMMKKGQGIARWEYACLVMPMMVFALTKIVYIPLAVLLLLIPSRSFGSLKKKFILIATLVAVAVLLSGLWTYRIRHIQAVSNANATAWLHYEVDPKAQLKFVATHPIGYITTILNTYVTTNGDAIEQEFIGTLGWLDTQIPLWIVILDLMLIAYCLASVEIPYSLTYRQRTVVAIAGLVPFLGVTTALYAYNNPVGYPWVTGLQGRYLIPLSPLLVPLVANLKTSVRPPQSSLKTLAVTVSAAVLILSLCVLYNRYYS